jgi:hypothetical protein
MASKISESAINLLQHAEIDGSFVRFPQVPYEVYSKVKPVMVALNAPWQRKPKAHVFADGVDPCALIQQVLISGKMPESNPLAFFPTSPKVALKMVRKMQSLVPVFPNCRILEPEAGEGAIAQEVLQLIRSTSQSDQADLQLIELDSVRAEKLQRQGYSVQQSDFLAMLPHCSSEQLFQAILMNPPFAIAGSPRAYIDHIAHAFAFWLESGGGLVAIAPAGFATNSDRKTEGFRQLVEDQGGWEFLDDDAFKGAGTSVRTVMLWMTKSK